MITFTIETPHLDKDASECLFNNIDLIRSNKKFILSKKKYRDIRIKGIFAAGLYVGGSDIPLGVLLNLWDKTNWCSSNRLYFNVVGSPLSGMNSCGWFNLDTKKLEFGKIKKWHDLAPIAMKYVNKNKDQKARDKQLQRWQEKNKREKCSFAEWSKKIVNGELKYIPKPKRTPTLTTYQLVELLLKLNESKSLKTITKVQKSKER